MAAGCYIPTTAGLVGKIAVAVRRLAAVRIAAVEEHRIAAAELHKVVEMMRHHTVPEADLQELRTVAEEVRRMVAGIRMGLVEEHHIGLEEGRLVRRIAGEALRMAVVVVVRHIVLAADQVERRIAAVADRIAVVVEHHIAAEEGIGLPVVRHMAVGCKTL